MALYTKAVLKLIPPDARDPLINPDLDPEKGWTYDLGVKAANVKNPWSFGLFYMDIKDKINYEYNAYYVGKYVNVDKYRAWGAEASALLYSLIETARANSCEPYSYLRHIFTHLPGARLLADYEALLPWNLDRAKLMLATVEAGD